MKCEEIRARLDEYVDGDLTEAEFQEVELHVGLRLAAQGSQA